MHEDTGGQSVLIVDDDAEVLDSCKELLTHKGFKVTACQDSTRAIPLVREKSFDAVLLDIRMPGIDGSDLLPLIKKLKPDLPVIVVSAYQNGTSSPGYYHSLGAFEALAKPLSPELLLDTLARAIQHQEEIPLVLTSLSLADGRDQLYRKLILTALQKTNWNQVKASKVLGVSRYSLMRWIKKLDISFR